MVPNERHRLLQHLLRLDAESRRLRFSGSTSDECIREYVAGLRPDRDRILVQTDDDLRIIAAVHIAPGRDGMVEFAFSVDQEYRGRGLGYALFEQAIAWARNRRYSRVCIYCLSENKAMRTLARKFELDIEIGSGESEGCLALSPPTPVSVAQELASESQGLLDLLLKVIRRPWRPEWQTLPVAA